MHKRQYDLLLVHFLRRRHRDEIKESKKKKNDMKRLSCKNVSLCRCHFKGNNKNMLLEAIRGHSGSPKSNSFAASDSLHTWAAVCLHKFLLLRVPTDFRTWLS